MFVLTSDNDISALACCQISRPRNQMWRYTKPHKAQARNAATKWWKNGLTIFKLGRNIVHTICHMRRTWTLKVKIMRSTVNVSLYIRLSSGIIFKNRRSKTIQIVHFLRGVRSIPQKSRSPGFTKFIHKMRHNYEMNGQPWRKGHSAKCHMSRSCAVKRVKVMTIMSTLTIVFPANVRTLL